MLFIIYILMGDFINDFFDFIFSVSDYSVFDCTGSGNYFYRHRYSGTDRQGGLGHYEADRAADRRRFSGSAADRNASPGMNNRPINIITAIFLFQTFFMSVLNISIIFFMFPPSIFYYDNFIIRVVFCQYKIGIEDPSPNPDFFIFLFLVLYFLNL